MFIWSSTCFGRHTAHHQEPKTALAASDPPTTRPTTFHVWKTRGCQCSFRLLMMGGVSPETCWASYKHGIIKFWYTVASRWIFLYELYYDARIHERQTKSKVCLTMKMEALRSFDMSGAIYPAIQHNIAEDLNRQQHASLQLWPSAENSPLSRQWAARRRQNLT